jgi:adhesin/invasin
VLPVALTVRVTDEAGRAVMGATVTFSVTNGNGTVSSGTVVTNASGLAETTLTLGQSPGANTVRASIAGPAGQVSVTFTATGT